MHHAKSLDIYKPKYFTCQVYVTILLSRVVVDTHILNNFVVICGQFIGRVINNTVYICTDLRFDIGFIMSQTFTLGTPISFGVLYPCECSSALEKIELYVGLGPTNIVRNFNK